MKVRRLFLLVTSGLFLSVFIFIFFGQYKFIRIKSSSGKSIGLWSISQFLLNKDLDAISKKNGTNFLKKQKGFKISFVNKSQTNIQFSNSGIHFKCSNEISYNSINISIDENKINNKNIASNLYFILLKCSVSDLNQNSQVDKELMNHLMRVSSDKNIYKSLFIPLGR